MSEISKLDFYKRYIGLRVCKKSKNGTVPKPFKSGKKINTVKEVVEHPFLFAKVLAFKFKEDESIVACEGCRILPDISIDLTKVEELYPGCTVIGVSEYYIPVAGWIKNDFPDVSLDEKIRDCIFQNAERVNLIIKHEGLIKYPDYKLSELVTNSTFVS